MKKDDSRTVLRKRLIGAAALAVSAGLVAWLLGRIDGARAIELLRRARWEWLVAAFLCTCGLPFLAALRWLGVLAAQPHEPLPYSAALRAVMLANALNSFLPSKAGDAAKAVYLRRRAGFSAGLGTVALERLVDLGVLGALGAVGSLATGVEWGFLAGLGLLGAVAAVFALVCLLPADRPLPLPEKAARLAADATAVFRAWLGAPRAIAATLAASLCHWALAGLIVCSLIAALGGELAWGRAFGVFPLALLAGLAPVTVSGIGTRDAAFVALLTAVGLPAEEATLVGLGYTVFSYWILSLISLPAVGMEGLRLARSREGPADGE